MNLSKFFHSILIVLIAVQSFTSVEAQAASATGIRPAAQCAASARMTTDETSTYYMFNARLSHLDGTFGKSSFDEKLAQIVTAQFAEKTRVADVSPLYFERLENLIQQAKLRNVIAKTIGLKDVSWKNFEYHMRNITLHQETSGSTINPFPKAALALVEKLKAERQKVSNTGKTEFVEALISVSEMFNYLQKMRVVNGEIQDAEASATAKTVTAVAIGGVGMTFLVGTLVFAAPVVTGVGAVAASTATNAVWAIRLAKLGEIAAGGAVGAFGAPAAKTTIDSYHTISEAYKQSLNNNSSYSCEIDKSMKHWREVAAEHTVSASLLGLEMGVGGGLLTLNKTAAKALLRFTAAAVLTAQGYTLGQVGWKYYKATSLYELAAEAERAGKLDESKKYLQQARDAAQEMGDKALEAIIVGTLTNHGAHHFHDAMIEGASAIRKLYAASADTIPTAGIAVWDILKSGKSLFSGK